MWPTKNTKIKEKYQTFIKMCYPHSKHLFAEKNMEGLNFFLASLAAMSKKRTWNMCASFPQKNKTLPLIFSLMLKALLNRNCLPSLKVICFSNTSSFQYFIPNNLSLDSWCMTLHTSLYDFVFCHVRLSKRVPYVCGGYEGGSRGKKLAKYALYATRYCWH